MLVASHGIACPSAATTLSEPSSRDQLLAGPPGPMVMARGEQSFISITRFPVLRRGSNRSGLP